MVKKFIIPLVFLSFMFLNIASVSVNTCSSALGDSGSAAGDGNKPAAPVVLVNPLPTGTTIPSMIAKVITAALGIVGSLALLMFVYGGFTWMLSAGSAEKVKKGREILIWASIGLAVVFTSYTLVSFVITNIKK